jgi:hypothetical protein
MSNSAKTDRAADRNLLFGVLALQADLIDAARFAEACTAWSARKDTSLASLMVERGWLTPADRENVEQFLERKLKKHGGDIHASLAFAANSTLPARPGPLRGRKATIRPRPPRPARQHHEQLPLSHRLVWQRDRAAERVDHDGVRQNVVACDPTLPPTPEPP